MFWASVDPQVHVLAVRPPRVLAVRQGRQVVDGFGAGKYEVRPSAPVGRGFKVDQRSQRVRERVLWWTCTLRRFTTTAVGCQL